MADFHSVRNLAFIFLMLAAFACSAATPLAGADPPSEALPASDEIILGNFHLRLVGILENDPDKDYDDAVQVAVKEGDSASELIITELRIAEYGGYAIHVFNVVPSKAKPGGGTAKIQVRGSTRRNAPSHLSR